jgi:pilus assembly protein FimV
MRVRGLARLNAAAAAALLCASLAYVGDAQALALGRVVVRSALGEPLRAEVDVLEITPEEAASLRVNVAPADAFRAAGMELSPALNDLQVVLQRRADGRSYLSLTGPRTVTEPFLDLILEANWAAGRVTRDYTLLFDPANLRPVAPAPLSPSVGAVPAPAPATPAAAPAPATGASVALPAAAPARAAARPPAPIAPKAPDAAAESSRSAGAQQVRVQAGDTAGRIAERNRPASASLDQMLVALLRANPKAFIGGNVNRIKAGVVLDMPEQAAVGETSAPEARRIITAQSRDFNEFRRRLAGSVPAAAVAAADRQASGRVTAEVEDKKPAPATQDKLTLSKGATSTQAAKDEQIAKERQSKESASRVAELSRNIDELAKLGPAVKAVPPVAAASAGAEKPTTAPAPAVVAVPAPPPVPAPATVVAAAPAPAPEPAPAPAPAPAAATPAPVAAPKPAPETSEPAAPSFVQELMGNPLVLPVAGGLLALLAGLGVYRYRQRKKGSGVDSSFLESRLQPDSFFGSSGGQRIDTNEAAASGSSMVYSPSQLDAAGDVDPVAEADVYLAYGRDLQAEEILKEAMRSTPTRVAIHNKLLEIYAKRRDAKAFEVVATEAFALTQGQGPEWEHACELGKELDPGNALYKPGGSPALKAGAVAGGAGATVPFGNSTLAQQTSPGVQNDGDLDLDLDITLEQASESMPLQAIPSAEARVSAMDDLNLTDALTAGKSSLSDPVSKPMDFDLEFPSQPAPLERPAAMASGAKDLPTFDANQELPDFEFSEGEPLPSGAPSKAAPLTPAADMLSFDMSDINLDLNTKPEANEATDLAAESPLETKLSLAEEFRAIGDLEGARSLAEEVVSEASGTLKTRASTFLADLA